MLPIRPFQSSLCFPCDGQEKSSQAKLRDIEECESAVISFPFSILEITFQEILIIFWSKEILNLLLFSCPHISSKQIRFRKGSSLKAEREMNVSCYGSEGQDSQLQPDV